MCGIVGMVSAAPVAKQLIAALSRLEYRGYDSAGIGLAGPGFLVRKVVGQAANLLDALQPEETLGHTGIAHTRWATHGKPEARNAHPHVCDGIAVVHNGIIENHAVLREELIAKGHEFQSDTDSEVVPHLIAEARRAGASPIKAVRDALSVLHGAYAIAAIFQDAPNELIVARLGSPVMVGAGAGVGAVASDSLAMSGFCTRMIALEDGDLAIVSARNVKIFDASGHLAPRAWQPMIEDVAEEALDRFEHHTRREIAEQPKSLRATDAALRGLTLPATLAAANRLLIVACGSSLFAAATARGWIETLAGLPCDIEIASEFRYREAPIAAGTVAVLVSQSGETADTLALLPMFAKHNVPVIAVVNVAHSSLARAAGLVWPTVAGREQGVAATKSFTAQLMALLRLGLAYSLARGGDAATRAAVETGLAAAPSVCAEAEELEPALADLARRVVAENEALFIGRRAGAAIAGEAALKLKELSYLRAEAYAAGELKHGPIALIRPGSPVLVFAGQDALLPKTISNAEEVKARGAWVTAFTDAEGAAAFAGIADTVLTLPGEGVSHLFAQAVALQLLSYHAALALDRNVDRPRNLAKSVTVE